MYQVTIQYSDPKYLEFLKVSSPMLDKKVKIMEMPALETKLVEKSKSVSAKKEKQLSKAKKMILEIQDSIAQIKAGTIKTRPLSELLDEL